MRATFLLPTITTAIVIMVSPLVNVLVQAQTENMTMEEATNASLAQYPDMDENADNVTDMEEATNALVGNVTGNMTSQDMTFGNMTS